MVEHSAMRIAVTGATGLIGSALARQLAADGHEVVSVTRHPRDATDIGWDPQRGAIDAQRLEQLDAVVHLAGEPIGAARWTRATRQRIMDSRRDGTALIATTLARLDAPPRVLVSGSAVGFYGDRGAEVIDEHAGEGNDFLAQVCVAWEAAAAPAREAGIRVVHPRTGVVIAREGALIDKVELPFRLGIGGRVGSGRQFVPWISMADEVAALTTLITSELEGPVNLVAPQQIDNRGLTKALGRALRRPTLLPIPVMAIRALYGQMGVTLATTSQRVVPKVLLDAGFSFQHDDLEAALSEALARP